MDEACKSQYPFLLGPLAPTAIPPEFYVDDDKGKNVFIVIYDDTSSSKYRGTLTDFNADRRTITLKPVIALNDDGTDGHTNPTGFTFPMQRFGPGHQFRSSRTGIPSLYDICFRQVVKKYPGFYDDPVVGGKSKKGKKSKKSKKRKRIKQ